MARDSLATADGRYSDAEVRKFLTADVTVMSPRFEVRSLDGRFQTHLSVSDAVVHCDVESAIPLHLQLTMEPIDDLRDVPFLYTVHAFSGVGPASRPAEHAEGVFLWTEPTQLVGSRGRETWKGKLGDKMDRHDSGGPGLEALTFKAGLDADEGIRQTAQRAGETDMSGIAQVDDTFESTLQYSYDRGDRKKKRKKNGKTEWVDLQGSAETYRLIEDDLHEDFGLEKPHHSLTGVYQAKAPRDYSAEPADHVYEVGKDSIWIMPDEGVELDPDLGPVANRVLATAQNKQDQTVPISADLNDFIPNHPLAERRCRHYRDLGLKLSASNAYKTIAATAQRELFDSIAYYQQVKIETGPNPAHELFDIVSLRIPGNAQLDTPQLYMEKGWTFDLFTGRMTHDLRRLYRIDTTA